MALVRRGEPLGEGTASGKASWSMEGAAANEYAGKRAARVGPVGDAGSLTACPLSGLDLKPHYTYNHVLRIVARELETLFRCPSSDPDRTFAPTTHSRTGNPSAPHSGCVRPSIDARPSQCEPHPRPQQSTYLLYSLALQRHTISSLSASNLPHTKRHARTCTLSLISPAGCRPQGRRPGSAAG